jgi:hypothetical protein
MVTMLELALSYAERGWPVFPLSPMTKVPPKGTHGRTDATTDTEQIRRWFTQWVVDMYVPRQTAEAGHFITPELNIGIDTDGAGLIVIDIDEPDGMDGWCKIVSDAGLTTEPKTYEVWTPSGGEHLYFKAIPGVRVARGISRLAPGIDVLSANSQVVAAGSKTPEGTYECVRNVKPKECPQWLRNALRKAGLVTTEFEERHKPPPKPPAEVKHKDSYVQGAINKAIINVAQAPIDTANEKLFIEAAGLGRFVVQGLLSEPQVHDALYPAAIQRGQSHNEAEATIASGLRRASA